MIAADPLTTSTFPTLIAVWTMINDSSMYVYGSQHEFGTNVG